MGFLNFIKQNWSRLSLAFLFLVGGLFAVTAWLNSGRISDASDGYERFYNTVLLISTLVFFFGMVCVTVLKSLPDSKKTVSVVYMSMGALVTILEVILLVVLCCTRSFNPELGVEISNATRFINLSSMAVESFTEFFVPLFVYGLHPLIKGITRFIEAEEIPAPAKTAVQPAAEESSVKKAPAAKKTAAKA